MSGPLISPPHFCAKCAKRRKARNPYKAAKNAATFALPPLGMLVAIGLYLRLVMHARAIDAFAVVEKTKVVEESRHPGWEVAVFVGGFVVAVGLVAALVAYGAWVADFFRDRARQWERRMQEDA